MCDICRRMFCPPSCPNYRGRSAERGRPIGKCAECGDYVYEDDLYYIEKNLLFCADCALDI